MKISIVLEAQTGSFSTDMDRAAKIAQKRLREIERSAKQVGAAIGTAMVAAAAVIAAGVKHAIDQADHLNDLNERLGLSAEALSGFAYAAKQTGTDIDGLGLGLKKLAKNMADALDPKSSQAGLFKSLDLKPIDAATGKLKTLEQFLPEVADRFKSLHDETLEAALAQELFGKSGTDLLEFLNLGSTGIEDMRKHLRDLGGELTDDDLKAADAFKDKLGDLEIATNALFTKLAADLLPRLSDLVDSMIDAAKEGSELREILAGLGTVIDTLVDFCRNLDHIWRGLVSTAIALYNAVDSLSKLNPGRFISGWITGKDGDSFAENWRELKTAVAQAREEFGKVGPAADSAAQRVHALAMSKSQGHGGHGAAGTFYMPSLKSLYNPPSDKPKSGTGKSDAEREAEQLEEAFKRMNEQMAETIALYGQEGEAVKVRYDLEHGELSKLSEAKKAELIHQAEHIDQLKEEAEVQAHLDELAKERQDTIDQAHQALAQTLSDMQFELDLMGKTNAERVAEIELRRISKGLSDEERVAAKQAIQAKAEELESVHKQVEAMDNLRGSFQDIFQEVAKGQMSLIDDLKAFADAFVAELIRMAAAQASSALFGQEGSTGGGFFGSLFSAFFGAKGSSSSASSTSDLFSYGLQLAGSYASGTDYHPGGLALVGEEGPELVNLPRGSSVTPAGQTARALGGFTQVNHMHFASPERLKTRQQIAAELNTVGQLAQRRRGVTA